MRHQPRILMISTSYPADAKDWRGVFIKHLVAAVARLPDFQLAVWAPPGELPENVVHTADREESEWLTSLMAAGGIAHLMRSGGWRAKLAPLQLLRWLRAAYRRSPLPDLYHINWLQNALPLPANGRPALVSVLGTDMQLMNLPGMVRLLRHRFRGRRVAICPNANWMVAKLEDWFGDIAEVVYIPFGIDDRWFRVQNMPQGRRWLCVSRLTEGKIGNLFDWCEPHFRNGDRELHLLGPMQQAMRLPDWVHHHGSTDADALSSVWFPTACGLITLSQHAEGRPQVMLEAMAAGLPILASSIPAHVDLLRHGDTGWLCDDRDEMEAGLCEIEDPLTGRELAGRAKAWVQSNIGTWDDCATRYASLYRKLLGSA